MTNLHQAMADYDILLPEYESPWYFFQKKLPFFLEQIQSKMEVRKYKKNEILFTQGQLHPDIFIVKRGIVRIMVGDIAGNEKHLMIAGPGSLLGSQSSLDGYPCLFTAITAEADCEAYRASSQTFFQMTSEIEGLKDFLIQDFCMKMRVLAGHIESLSFQSVDLRIVRAFLHLIRENGVETSHGIKICIQFTHREMADLVYSNRVTVSKFFGFLKRKGVLDKREKHYYITDVEYLYQYLTGEYTPESYNNK